MEVRTDHAGVAQFLVRWGRRLLSLPVWCAALVLACATAYTLQVFVALCLLLFWLGAQAMPRAFFAILSRPALLAGSCCALTLASYYLFCVKLKVGTRKSLSVLVSFVVVLMIMGAGTRELAWRGDVNEFGLLAFQPNSKGVIDYSQGASQWRKDEYPVSTFEYNSWGYRDIEPDISSRARRILVVGDSYVWGDGIPSNEQTLAAFIRAGLERIRPGEYSVMSAAYPGLALYGFSRIVEKLTPIVQPDLVFIGFQGEGDFDPFDIQFILDHLPSSTFLRNWMFNSHSIQKVNESLGLDPKRFWLNDRAIAMARERLRMLSDLSRTKGIPIVLIEYGPGSPHAAAAEGLRVFSPPSELLYGAHSYREDSGLWYVANRHPTPKLNRILGDMLAGGVVEHFKTGGRTSAFRLIKAVEDIAVGATLVRREGVGYDIVLRFGTPMMGSHSYLCDYTTVETRWSDESTFVLTLSVNEALDRVSLALNPEGYSEGFRSRDGRRVKPQAIVVDVGKTG